MDIVEKFMRPLQRQIAEGVAIHCSSDDVSIKNKNEWIQPTTSRIIVSREVAETGRNIRLPG